MSSGESRMAISLWQRECHERPNDREHARTGCRARGENGCQRLRGESPGNRLQRVRADGVFDTQVHAHVVSQSAVRNERRQSGVVRKNVSHIVKDDLREFVAPERGFFRLRLESRGLRRRRERCWRDHLHRVRALFVLQPREMPRGATKRVAFALPLGITRAVRSCALWRRIPVGRAATRTGVRGIGTVRARCPLPTAAEASVFARYSRTTPKTLVSHQTQCATDCCPGVQQIYTVFDGAPWFR